MGEGEFATVQKAREKSTGEMVAIKRLKSKFLGTCEENCFAYEIDVLSQLSHPNIIRYRGDGSGDVLKSKYLVRKLSFLT